MPSIDAKRDMPPRALEPPKTPIVRQRQMWSEHPFFGPDLGSDSNQIVLSTDWHTVPPEVRNQDVDRAHFRYLRRAKFLPLHVVARPRSGTRVQRPKPSRLRSAALPQCACSLPVCAAAYRAFQIVEKFPDQRGQRDWYRRWTPWSFHFVRRHVLEAQPGKMRVGQILAPPPKLVETNHEGPWWPLSGSNQSTCGPHTCSVLESVGAPSPTHLKALFWCSK